MNTQTINIEETIFRNSVKAVISELKCANRFLSGEVPVTVSSVKVSDVVSIALDQAKTMAGGFSSVFDSTHYCFRFHAIQQVVCELVYKGSFSLTVQNIQSVISVLEAYLKPVAKPGFKQVDLFDCANSDVNNKSRIEQNIKARETLAYVLIESVPLRSLTIQKLDSLGFFFCKDLFALSKSDFRKFKKTLNKRCLDDIFDTFSKYGIYFE